MSSMPLILDSFWRAALYCLHPRVIALSILPLLGLTGLGIALGYFFWDDAVHSVWLWLSQSMFFNSVLDWFSRFGMGSLRSVVAPFIVIALATPVLILCVMLVVAVLMTPAMLGLITQRRFPTLTKLGSGSLWRSVGWSLSSTLMAMLLLLFSLPFWLFLPLMFLLPPLIWGWLAYRVMSYDALLEHATSQERKAVLVAHRIPLLSIGILSGYLGAMPSLIWAFGSMASVFAVLLLPIALWLYTLIFAFSSLWFVHYCLAALSAYRKEQTHVTSASTSATAVGTATVGAATEPRPDARVDAPPRDPQQSKTGASDAAS